MRKIAYLIAFLVTLPLFAQQATVTSPVARSAETKHIFVDFAFKRDCVCTTIVTEYQDAGGNATRQVRYDVPDPNFPSATLQGLAGAMISVRATETGTNLRKLQFRVLGYLADNGYLAGETLAP